MTSPLQQDAECALSRATGLGRHAKDFDFAARNVPCVAACPAGTDIPGYLEAIAAGDVERAYRINLESNVFPGVLGRVCTRPCEPACRHGWEGLGEPVAICWSKRWADEAMRSREPIVLDPVFQSSGHAVGIVGGGAAGLATARELARWGHAVTVYEQHAEPGGMMVQGIPEFRLPRDVVRREIEQVTRCGVTLECGFEVGRDATLVDLRRRHDAVVVAAGTFRPNRPDIPGIDLPHVRHGVEFLAEIHRGDAPAVGNRVVVVGGGFTAVDCVRVVRRLGAEEVRLVYRRRLGDSYIPTEEFHQLTAEGIEVRDCAAPAAITAEAVRFVETEVVDGVAVPRPGREFEWEADRVLLGTGQAPNLDWLEPEHRDIATPAHETSVPGLFVAGDFGTGPGSLIDAIGHARACARAVDRWLMEEDRFVEGVQVENVGRRTTGRTPDMDRLPRREMPVQPIEARSLRGEVETGLTRSEAEVEATRCYLCNYKFEIDNDLCIYCDRCLKVMPVEDCIVKASRLVFDEADRITGVERATSPRDYNLLHLDGDRCIRCGQCVEVCPVDCITLQKVTRVTLPARGATGTP